VAKVDRHLSKCAEISIKNRAGFSDLLKGLRTRRILRARREPD